jgi:hypothetical protein
MNDTRKIYRPEKEDGKFADLVNQSPEDIGLLFDFYHNAIQTMLSEDKRYKLRIYIEEMPEDSE